MDRISTLLTTVYMKDAFKNMVHWLFPPPGAVFCTQDIGIITGAQTPIQVRCVGFQRTTGEHGVGMRTYVASPHAAELCNAITGTPPYATFREMLATHYNPQFGRLDESVATGLTVHIQGQALPIPFGTWLGMAQPANLAPGVTTLGPTRWPDAPQGRMYSLEMP